MNTQETNEIIKQVIEANKYMIETLFDKAPFDRTETGLVMGLNVDNSNLVNVKIGNKVYSDIPTTINVSVNDVVKICVPQNNTNNMYVSGKLGEGLVSNNAGGHNSIYRGKFLGNSVTNEQYNAIANGTFEDLFIGDYWTIDGMNYRIGSFNYYLNVGKVPVSVPHAVIIPDNVFYYTQMNNTSSGKHEDGVANTTQGGYALSDMRTKNLERAKQTIRKAFSGHILSHQVFLVNKVVDGKPTSGSWYDSDIELMTETMVYGNRIYGSPYVPSQYVFILPETTQLSLFAYDPSQIVNKSGYWLRDVSSSSSFACCNMYGGGDQGESSYNFGVRPYFCIY